ncbi:hypothetical protein FJZ31_38540 [Candidatus Poribacteria bacterium]|nr:hypothetical protein [Candidatus Poribacteria bacterium]
MRSLKSFSLIVLAMLLMSANVSAEVYDDEGEVITEEEIEAEMGSRGRAGCLFFGGLFSLGASFLGSCVLGLTISDSIGNDEIVVPVLVIGTIAGAVLGGKLSYEVGESIDRRAAIKRINERHRKKKQGLLNLEDGQFFLVHPELQLKSNRLHYRQNEDDVVIPLITVGF